MAADAETILLIDDEEEIVAVMREHLEGEGYRVLAAASCREGLAALREECPALLLLDLMLPDGNGVDVMRAALGQDPAPAVVIVTGHATVESAVAAVEAGAAGYVLKPVDLTRLTAQIAAVLEQRRLARENAALQAQLTEHLRETEALFAISQTLTSTVDLPEALRRICRELARLTGAETVSAYLYDRATDLLRPCAAYHVPPEYLARLASIAMPLREQGFHLPIWRDRHPVDSDDVANDARFNHDAFRAFPHQSGLILPLVLDDEVAGAFYLVWWKARRRIGESERGLLEGICRQVGLLLRNARLFADGERQRRRLEILYELAARLAAVHDREALLSLIVDELARVLNADAAGLRLLEDDRLVLGAHTASAAPLLAGPPLKVGQGLSGRVVATGQPLVVDDVTEDERVEPASRRRAVELGFHGFMSAPLRAGGRTIGSLSVFTRERRAFGGDDVSLLAAFADNAALAIEKARLLDISEQHRRMLARLHEVNVTMLSSWSGAERLGAFLVGANSVIGFDRVWVLLALGDAFELVAVRGVDLAPPARLPLTPAAGPFYEAFETRRPVAVLDDEALARVAPLDPRYRNHPCFRSRRFVVAPLVAGTRVVGVAAADNKTTRRPIPTEMLEAFTLLCQQLSTALENSRLYEDVQGQRVQLRQILESTSDGIVLVDHDGALAAVNHAAGELLGLVPDVVLGTRATEALAHLAGSGAVGRELLAALAPDARLAEPWPGGDFEVTAPARRILHWSARPTLDAGGTQRGVTVTFQDVTHEREISQMKSDFVGFVTHQLRTPLAGIKWLLELAAKASELSAETRSYVDDSRESATRLTNLVNELLDVSRLESGRLVLAPEPIRLVEVTWSVLDEFTPQLTTRGHRLVTALDGHPAVVIADPQMLRQALANLVSNAIKYTPPGGTITVGVGREGDRVTWTVRDTGLGVPKEAHARLFEKFFRAENVRALDTEGTGLGLYLVRLILEQFAGTIRCESEEGRGAAFTVTLPAAETST